MLIDEQRIERLPSCAVSFDYLVRPGAAFNTAFELSLQKVGNQLDRLFDGRDLRLRTGHSGASLVGPTTSSGSSSTTTSGSSWNANIFWLALALALALAAEKWRGQRGHLFKNESPSYRTFSTRNLGGAPHRPEN
jgi:hypothetical protein